MGTEKGCESYDLFSKVYRELITATGHLQRERRLLDELVLEHKIGRNDMILDAACGTGDALHHLREQGFAHLFGLDGSTGMLRKAMDILGDIALECRTWVHLNEARILMGKQMDFVFILSNSLAHTEKGAIPGLIQHLYHKIAAGGVLAIDARVWQRNDEGRLFEPNRPVGQLRRLASVLAEGRRWTISDHCSYEGERQWITYHCATDSAGAANSRSIQIRVSYAAITAKEIADACCDAGFQSVHVRRRPPWPYDLIEATKKP